MKNPTHPRDSRDTRDSRHAKRERQQSWIPKDEQVDLPTTDQLAMIAATLARSAQLSPEELANTAMALWNTSRTRIIEAAFLQAIKVKDVGMADYSAFFEPPKDHSHFPKLAGCEYPIKRDVFLQAMLPQYKSRPDKVKEIAHHYLSALWHKHTVQPLPKDKLANLYASWPIYNDADAASQHARSFNAWYQQYISESRRKAGLKSAENRNPKKTL